MQDPLRSPRYDLPSSERYSVTGGTRGARPNSLIPGDKAEGGGNSGGTPRAVAEALIAAAAEATAAEAAAAAAAAAAAGSDCSSIANGRRGRKAAVEEAATGKLEAVRWNGRRNKIGIEFGGGGGAGDGGAALDDDDDKDILVSKDTSLPWGRLDPPTGRGGRGNCKVEPARGKVRNADYETPGGAPPLGSECGNSNTMGNNRPKSEGNPSDSASRGDSFLTVEMQETGLGDMASGGGGGGGGNSRRRDRSSSPSSSDIRETQSSKQGTTTESRVQIHQEPPTSEAEGGIAEEMGEDGEEEGGGGGEGGEAGEEGVDEDGSGEPRASRERPDISTSSLAIYNAVQRKGETQASTCFLCMTAFLTFMVTILLSIAILVAPKSFGPKESEPVPLNFTVPIPAPNTTTVT